MASNENLLKLRQELKASFGLCKQAAEKYPDDYEKAKTYLVELIKENSGKREGRVTQNGVIETYVHAGGTLASMVEVLCETDFVAKNSELKELARNVALQVVAAAPLYISSADIPAEVMAEQEKVWNEELKGKPEAVAAKILEGKKAKYFAEVCLLNQAFFKDESKTIEDLVKEVYGKLGENIKISRIERWQI